MIRTYMHCRCRTRPGRSIPPAIWFVLGLLVAGACAWIGYLRLNLRVLEGEPPITTTLPAGEAEPDYPDRVVLTWTGDPATTQTVTWRTNNRHAFGEIANDSASPDFVHTAKRVKSLNRAFVCDSGDGYLHRVTFENLEPGTRYLYRVGDGKTWSEWYRFRTAAVTPEPFSFIWFGDVQNDIISMCSRVIREAYATDPQAAFVAYTGDIVAYGEADLDWASWFWASQWIHATIPSIATPGNHEYPLQKDGKTRQQSSFWKAQFAFPENGVEGLAHTVYYIDYQNLRIISLNSSEQMEKQGPWLEKVLADNDKMWTIVIMHHPLVSFAAGRDSTVRNAVLEPVLDRSHVDLVLSGHDHVYGRTGLIMPDTQGVGGAITGTVYAVSVCGPKSYKLGKPPKVPVKRVAQRTQLFQIISIDGSTLKYESRLSTGELYDAFTLHKRPGQPNELIDQVPPTPDRRGAPATQSTTSDDDD